MSYNLWSGGKVSVEKRRIHALLIEDERDDYILTRHLLSDSTTTEVDLAWAPTYDEGYRLMQQARHDIYLLDYNLGTNTGLELLRAAPEGGWQAPVVMLTGQGDLRVDYEAMKAGAVDYLDKRELTPIVLERTIRYAVERKQAEAQRVELAVERERVKMLEQFIADASHDLRTAMSVVFSSVEVMKHLWARVNSEFLKLEPTVTPQQQPTFEQIQVVLDKIGRYSATQEVGSTRLWKLMEDLLDMIRLDRSSAFDYRRLSMNRLAGNFVQEHQLVAEKKRLTLAFEGEVELPEIEGDETALSQVVGNLLDNAVNYTPDGGQISVRTYRQDQWVVLEVRDTGIGIAPEHLPRIFDRFYRVDKARSPESGGTGLGLSIVKKIVEGHKGGIEVESAPNKGSIFRVFLPVAAVPASV
jgi:signal transduction histidine kinase